MNANDCLNDLFGKNSMMILSDIDKIRSIGQSFNFTVSEHKKFNISLRNAEMIVKNNSAFLNFIFKNQTFYLFTIFKQFLKTSNKLDTFEEYYTKLTSRNKNAIHGLHFFKLYQQSFEQLYKLSEYMLSAKSLIATKV